MTTAKPNDENAPAVPAVGIPLDHLVRPRVWARKDQLQAVQRGGLLCSMYPNIMVGRTDLEPLYDGAAIDVERQARIEAEALVFSHEGRIERMETLLRRGLTLMNRWQVFYGDADHCMRNDLPLPPAGQVDWAEDVDAVLGPNMAMSGVRHERD